MNALRHNFDLPQSGPQPSGSSTDASINANWATLHEAAQAVAELAQLGGSEDAGAGPALGRLNPERSAAMERGLDDLAAVMQAGLSALLAASENGRDTTAAALTLWREFHAGRTALLALSGPGDSEDTPPHA